MKFQRNARRYSMLLNIQSCTEKLLQNDDAGFVELSLERLSHNSNNSNNNTAADAAAAATAAPADVPNDNGTTGRRNTNTNNDINDANDHSDSDTNDSIVPALVHALSVNETVRHVCFSGTFVRDCSPYQWKQVLHGVGFVLNLQELQIWCATIPVATFATVFEHAQQLQKVYLFQVRLAAESPADYDDRWGPAIRQHPHLTEFRLGGIQTITETTAYINTTLDTTTNGAHDNAAINPNAIVSPLVLDSLIEAMAETPHLTILSLQLSSTPGTTVQNGPNNNNNAPFSARALERLLSSHTLTDVYLTRLGLQQDHLHVIAHIIPHTTTLRVLDLFGNPALDESLFLQMATALQHNVSLETLVLPCHRPPLTAAQQAAQGVQQQQARGHNRSRSRSNSMEQAHGAETTLSLDCAVAIAQAVQVNSTLVTLTLPRCLLCETGLLHLAQALTVNTTLKRVEVGLLRHSNGSGDFMDESVQAAWTNMLEQNYNLERLIVTGSGGSALRGSNGNGTSNSDAEAAVAAAAQAEQAFHAKIDYYLRLNAVGRGSLLRSRRRQRQVPRPGRLKNDKATEVSAAAMSTSTASDAESDDEEMDTCTYNNRAEWIEMLISVRDDLDCLFYFTTMNPTVCQFANAGLAESIVEIIPPTPKEQRRRHSMLDGAALRRAGAAAGTATSKERTADSTSRRASVF